MTIQKWTYVAFIAVCVLSAVAAAITHSPYLMMSAVMVGVALALAGSGLK